MTSPVVPQYHRIKMALLEEIEQGAYRRDRPFITEREICSRFGVSRATAVRTLTDLVHAGVLVRQRGRGTFVATPADRAAQRPPLSDGRLIGCVFQHLYGSHPMSIIRGVEHACRLADYRLLLFDSEGSPETEARNIQRARASGAQGLIVYPVDGLANTATFDGLQRADVPFVLVDRYYPTLPTDVVVANNVAIGYQLTDHLIHQGNRHIAAVWGETACTSIQDRLTGYRMALQEYGLSIEPALCALRPYAELPSDKRQEILASWLEASYRPTAYLAANGEALALVVSDLLDAGVRIPEDVTVASMDNANADALLSRATASASLPSYDMGREAMRLLRGRLDGVGDIPAQHIVLPVDVRTKVSIGFTMRMMAAS